MSMEEYTFVDLVEKCPQLWDKKEPLFKDVIASESAWKAISDLMNFTVDESMALWKSLRQKYVRERKLRKSLPNGSKTYKCSWPLYEKLGFLDRTIISRNTKRRWSSNNSGPSQVWQSTVVSDHRMLQKTEHKDQNESEGEEETEDRINSPQEEESSADPFSSNITSEVKRLRSECFSNEEQLDFPSENLVATSSNLKESLNSMVGDGTLSKEDYHFGISLAESLAAIKNSKKKLNVKAKILMLIADAIE